MANRRKTYSKGMIDIIFSKAKPTGRHNRRLDISNLEIDRASYGQEGSIYGWNVDHIDGNRYNNDLTNLQPLHYVTHKEKNRR
ncbi:MAG: HNH endonuclease [Mycoplasma sp.]|nr:HNH endonuclease [Mycoplasma sp.]